MKKIITKTIREVIIRNMEESIMNENWLLFYLSLLLLPFYTLFILMVVIAISPIILINNLSITFSK